MLQAQGADQATPPAAGKPGEDAALQWDFPGVYSIRLTVRPADCDDFGHTNNVVYLQWLQDVAWAHSRSLGLDFVAYERIGAGVVARRHELDYLAASFPGDELVVGTWITHNDGRLDMWRAFQIIRRRDAQTLLRAKTRFVCIDLHSGRPRRRQPPEFVRAYVPIAVAGPVQTR